MSKKLLQQEEIDALLSAQVFEPDRPGEAGVPLAEQSQEAADGAESSGEEPPGVEPEVLTDEEKDALGEVGNICMGSSATTLSVLLNQPVTITSPRVTVTTMEDLFRSFATPHMTIHVRFIEGISGYNLLMMKLQDAAILADLMMGGDGANTTGELDEFSLSAASEAMNQMIGSASTAMAAMFSRTVNISPPEIQIYNSADEPKPLEMDHDAVVVVWFKMTVGSILDTQLMQVMGIDTAREEASLILGQLSEAGGEGHLPAQEEPPARDLPDNMEGSVSGPEPAMPLETAVGPHGSFATGGLARTVTGGNGTSAAFRSGAAPPAPDQGRLDLILDIPLKVTVLLGRTRWPIKDILGLTPGAVVELQSLVDEPVEVLVNGVLVALGEVVVVNENFGVRITNIISPEERLQNLRR